MKSVAIGIVTYNPTISLFEDELRRFKEDGYLVFVVDNCSDNVKDIERVVSLYGHNIVKNPNNYGIAKALNQLFQLADNDGFKYILTMDQDSIVPKGFVEGLLDCCVDKTAIVCPYVHYIGAKKQEKIKTDIVEKNWAITSGALCDVNVWKEVGGFDENMFIDYVDYDYCFRVRKNGYKIIQNNSIKLRHNLGNTATRRFLFWRINVGNHSPIRKYYKARNIKYLNRKKEIGFLKAIKMHYVMLIEVLFYEKDKKKKIKAISLGWSGKKYDI